jgi:UDP-N-acetylmuramate: L-alanyl-gamma-D-glutamyl-meso-diaminopimelate ligase
MKKIAWISPCDDPQEESVNDLQEHLNSFSSFAFEKIFPRYSQKIGWVNEKAALLSYGLTRRDLDVLWSVKGGRGATGVLTSLKQLLPPVLPPQILVGFSDFSLLGCWLSFHYPLFYLHGGMSLKQTDGGLVPYKDTLILGQKIWENQSHSTSFVVQHLKNCFVPQVTGLCLPVNLSLLPSLLIHQPQLPNQSFILFIEDCNEHQYRSLRVLETLKASAWSQKIVGIVMGSFSSDEEDVEPLCFDDLSFWVKEHLKIPCAYWPEFGHGDLNRPLLCHGKVTLKSDLSLRFENKKELDPFPYETTLIGKKLYFSGISGTGMAACARLAYEKGFDVSGNDQKFAPPTGPWLETFTQELDQGYEAQFKKKEPDALILANIHSRRSRSGGDNIELEALLKSSLPFLSFPKLLHVFLREISPDICCVVAGTHGKTTTTAALIHCFQTYQERPSFLIGGMPHVSPKSAQLGLVNLWILEGDEYDSAFFDKGPKFHHYEPNVLILTNVDYDHADIYPNFLSYQKEFATLIEMTLKRKGLIVYGHDCPNLRCLIEPYQKTFSQNLISFGSSNLKADHDVFSLSNFEKFEVNESFFVNFSLSGLHNRLNALGALIGFLKIQERRGIKVSVENAAQNALRSFQGVSQRLETVKEHQGRTFVRDFAHHPNALKASLSSFPEKSVRVLFDCHTASLRRKVFQKSLGEALILAKQAVLIEPALDERIPLEERFDSHLFSQNFPSVHLVKSPQEGLEVVWSNSQWDDKILLVSPGDLDGLIEKICVGGS